MKQQRKPFIGPSTLITIRGDSMMPRYAGGMELLFDHSRPFRNGSDCLVKLADGRACFRRVYVRRGKVRLVPLNQQYPTMRLTRAEVAEMTPVRFMCRVPAKTQFVPAFSTQAVAA